MNVPDAPIIIPMGSSNLVIQLKVLHQAEAFDNVLKILPDFFSIGIEM